MLANVLQALLVVVLHHFPQNMAPPASHTPGTHTRKTSEAERNKIDGSRMQKNMHLERVELPTSPCIYTLFGLLRARSKPTEL